LDRSLTGDLPASAALLAGASLFYLAKPVPAALFGLLIFACVSLLRIDLAALAVVVFLPYFQHPKTLFGHHFPPSEWLLLVVTVAAVILAVTALVRPRLLGPRSVATGNTPTWPRLQSPQWSRVIGSPFVLPGIVFLLAAGIATLASAERHLAARALLEVVFEPMLLFVLILLFAPADRARLNRALAYVGMAVALMAVVPSLIAFGQLLTHQHLVSIRGASYKRVPGPYSSPDNFGLLLDRSLPMAIAFVLAPLGALTAMFARLSDRHKGAPARAVWPAAITRAFFAGCVLIMGIALLLTFVLGAWLGSAIAVVAMLLIAFRPGWWVAGALAVVIVAAVVLGSGKSHSVTAGNRVAIWRSAIHMIRDHPILGIGLDNFQHYYAPTHGDGVGPNAKDPSGQCRHGLGYMEQVANSEPCLSHPHNEILDFWLSTGTLGLLAFAWLQIVFWRIVWRNGTTLASMPVLFGAAGAMAATLLHGLVDNSYFLVDLSALMWVLFALATLFASMTPAPTHPAQIGWPGAASA
jgi:O-antigen ligase